MARGYYWIPQTDETLNGRSYYVAKIVGDITFDTKRKRIVFQADRYFPVGSVFHFTHNCFNYIITCRLRKPGLWFEARREDSGPICPEDIERFESEGLFTEMGTCITYKLNLTIFRQIIIFFHIILSHQTEKLGGFIFYDMLDF